MDPIRILDDFCTFKLLQHLMRLIGMPKRLRGVARCEGRLALDGVYSLNVALLCSLWARLVTDYRPL